MVKNQIIIVNEVKKNFEKVNLFFYFLKKIVQFYIFLTLITKYFLQSF